MAVTVRQAMTANPVVVAPDTTVSECGKLMDRREIGALGVVRDERLVGVITDRDIVVRAIAHDHDPHTMSAGELATPDVVTVPVDADLEEAERLMGQSAVRRLFVVTDEGRPVGILSLDDLVALRDPDSAAAKQIREWRMVRSDQGFTGQVD
jgi:CBS domain-containing protein